MIYGTFTFQMEMSAKVFPAKTMELAGKRSEATNVTALLDSTARTVR